MGNIDYSTANAIFDYQQVIDSIEINSVLFQDARNIQIDSLHQTAKSQAFFYVDMYPTGRKGSYTGPAKQVKCKEDCGAMANIMPPYVFKMLHPSEPDKDGKSISGFNRDMTRLSAYGYRPIEEWMGSMRYTDNVQFDFQGPNYIHLESDIKSRL